MTERLSPVDRAWLLMDRPTNPMLVMGLLVLRRRLGRASLRRIVAERFLAFERFRRVPAADTLGAHWELAEQFDLDDHVLRVALPAPAGERELEALAGELASTPLNTGRPLWTFHLVEQYQGGSALIIRVHHCYADGIALMRVLLRLADAVPGSVAAAAAPSRHAAPAAAAGDASATLMPEFLTQALREGADLVGKGLHYALHPAEATTAAGTAAGAAAGIAGEVARMGLLLADDPPTLLKQELSGVKRVAWAAPLALEEVRTVAHLLGCTINDVLVATLAGAIGRYLDSQGDSTAGVTIRAAVPVNLRPQDDAALGLGNRFGLVFVDLPVGIRHPLQRLYAVHAGMVALKGSQQALVTFGLLSLVGTLPAAVEEPAVAMFSAKASLVASTLRGPEQPLHLAGAPVSQLLFWVPQSGSIGVGVSILSYRGEVQFGVIADRHLIPDPGQLVGLVQAEFDRLLYLLLLGAGSLTD
jgi:WS/DGAT/MGAT family acyltransferase